MNRSARETPHDLGYPNCVATMRHVARLAKFAVHPELRNLPLRCLRACETRVHGASGAAAWLISRAKNRPDGAEMP